MRRTASGTLPCSTITRAEQPALRSHGPSAFLRSLSCWPVLITHGIEDEIVLHTMSERHARLIQHAKTSSYADTGHATFWEAPERFNRELRTSR